MSQKQSIVFLVLFYSAGLWTGCSGPEFVQIQGPTMGTAYHITYQERVPEYRVKEMVDSLLVAINKDVSTYMDDAYISSFNQSRGEFILDTSRRHFVKNLVYSARIFEETNGYFDPTVMPLVNYWGFGYTQKRPVREVDSLVIDSMMLNVGFDQLTVDIEGGRIARRSGAEQLDFSAIAKGYAVDEVASLLSSLGIKNYLVEIGGEMITAGTNRENKSWTVAINTPKPEAGLMDAISLISLSNKALATSGNYRNFYEVDGQKYGHTIDPKTGFPFMSKLLSVTVIAENCMLADAYATGFMSMGYDKAVDWMDQRNDIDACFLVSGPDNEIEIEYSDGFIQYVKQF